MFGGFRNNKYICYLHQQMPRLDQGIEPVATGSAVVAIYGKAFIRFVSDLTEIWKIYVPSEHCNYGCSCK